MENIAIGNFTSGNLDLPSNARRADQRQHTPRAMLTLVTSAFYAEESETARTEAARFMRVFPDFRLGDLRRWPYCHPMPWANFTRGLVEAGLPQ